MEEQGNETPTHFEIKVDTTQLNEEFLASLIKDEIEDGETSKTVTCDVNGEQVPIIVFKKAGKAVDLESYVTSYESFTPQMLTSRTYKLIEEGLATDGISASETAIKKAEELLERLESADKSLRWSVERADDIERKTRRESANITALSEKLSELSWDADKVIKTVKKQEITGEAKRSLAVYRSVLEITKDVFGDDIWESVQAKAIEAASYAAWHSYETKN